MNYELHHIKEINIYNEINSDFDNNIHVPIII